MKDKSRIRTIFSNVRLNNPLPARPMHSSTAIKAPRIVATDTARGVGAGP
jgi:hypothetical protein